MMTLAKDTPIRIRIAYDVLEAAKDAGVVEVIAACRRVLNAYRLAQKADRADWTLIYSANEAFKA